MIIETLETKYEVIRYLYSDRHMDRYVCRDVAGDETYTCIRIKEKKWIASVMEFLMGQLDNEDFSDLAACFFSEEHLYIMMRYAEGVPLEDKLAYEENSIEERLEIGRSLLDRLILQNMPDYFMCDCLDISQILVSPGMSIGFLYELKDLVEYAKADFSDVQSRLSRIMEKLFSEELGKKTLPVMEQFIKTLKKAGYGDLISLYTEYDEILKMILEMDPNELLIPKTKAFRVWERIKKIFRPFKTVIAVLLILASVGFLIWSAYESSRTGDQAKVFEYIGSVTIK